MSQAPRRQQRQPEPGHDIPRDELDVANRFVEPTTYDELLQEVNLGTGYYEDEDLRLQMRSYRKGLVAEMAFDEPLWERALYETKIKLADEGFSYYDESEETVKHWAPYDEIDPDDYDGRGRTRILQERGEDIWTALSRHDQTLSDIQVAALSEKTSIEPFKPVFWRLLAAYHEASRSKGARTQDNFFGRVKKRLLGENDTNSGGLLFGGGGSES